MRTILIIALTVAATLSFLAYKPQIEHARQNTHVRATEHSARLALSEALQSAADKAKGVK